MIRQWPCPADPAGSRPHHAQAGRGHQGHAARRQPIRASCAFASWKAASWRARGRRGRGRHLPGFVAVAGVKPESALYAERTARAMPSAGSRGRKRPGPRLLKFIAIYQGSEEVRATLRRLCHDLIAFPGWNRRAETWATDPAQCLRHEHRRAHRPRLLGIRATSRATTATWTTGSSWPASWSAASSTACSWPTRWAWWTGWKAIPASRCARRCRRR